ncbi:MAG: ParB/RepB/Spo0J family partition protein [Meiothermus sp.]|nr:ParB/RepB/Spo0J family partition protein [Meiothermus sp.]
MTAHTLQLVPIPHLSLAPENTRQEADPEALEALKASIREQGLLQNLIGYQEGSTVQIVAGGHRLRALQALHQEGQGPAQVPVAIVDKTRALILSVSENLARKDLTPLEEAEAIASLAASGLSPEEIARELGRSLAYIQGRILLARDLAPEWRKALNERAIPLAVALALAELAPDTQNDLYRRYGLALRLETIKALQLKDAVPAKRMLPAALQAYKTQGGVVASDLSGEEYLQDRALAQRLQEEAARAQANRMQAEFLLDYPIHQLITVNSGGQNYVHLNSHTLEVRLFFSVTKREHRPSPPAAPAPGNAQAQPPEAGSASPTQGATAPAAPPVPAPASPPSVTPAPEKPQAASQKGRAEYRALEIRAWRERMLADERLRKAALVLAVMGAFHLSYQPQSGYFRTLEEGSFTPPQSPILGNRFRELSYEKHLTQQLEELLKQAGLNQEKHTKVTLEALLQLPDAVLEQAFALSTILLIARPTSGETVLPTLGMADQEHLKAYPSAAIEAALGELKLAAGKTKTENIQRLMEKPTQAFPQALLKCL